MNTQQLAMALRNMAAEVHQVNVTTEKESELLRDAGDLLRVLAHMVSDMPMAKAFGAPGDWGYRNPIGAAIAAAPEHSS